MENNLRVNLDDIPGDPPAAGAPELDRPTVGDRESIFGAGAGLDRPKTGRPFKQGTVTRLCPYCSKEYSEKSIKKHKEVCPTRRALRSEAASRAHSARARGEETGDPAAGAPEPEGVPLAVSPEMLAMAIAGLFDVIAFRFGSQWKLESIEAESLGAQWKNVLDAYAPKVSSKTLVLIFALVGTWAVLDPRIRKTLDDKSRNKRTAYSSRPERERQDSIDAAVA